MGDLHFKTPTSMKFDSRIWNTAYITGIEGIPWQCHHSQDGEQFSIGREIDESGKLNIVWPTQTLGNVCLSSTSLRVKDGSYDLLAEIARGTVYRLKSQTFEWQRIGLRLPEEFFPLAEAALNQLLLALSHPDDQSNERAQKAIELALKASVQLSDTFSAQALDARRNNEGRLSTLLGVQLQNESSIDEYSSAIKTAFNLLAVSADFGTVESTSGSQAYDVFDSQIAWASQTDHKICVGPLVDFRDGRLPDWMMLLDEGYDSILSAACEHVRKTVERYKGKAHLWNCATGLNVPLQSGWTDEEVLRIAVSLIETVRRADDRSPVLITIDQPWSEYLRDDATGISPLHFADALIRADLGLSGLALEMNFDQWPGGSLPRDPLEISRLIDRWSMLGLPLMVILSSPTSATNVPQDYVSSWDMEHAGTIKPESIIQLLMSKPSVHAILWNCLTAETSGSRPRAGLWDDSGNAHSVLNGIARLRRNFLH